MKDLNLPLSTDLLIPQKSLMRFVQQATDLEENCFATASDTSANIFRLKEGLDPVSGIEYMAQSCAALNGYRHLSEGGEKQIGFLAGITEFSFPKGPIPGEVLEALVTEDSVIPPFTLVSGTLNNESEEVGSGRMKVYEPEEVPVEDSSTVTASSGNESAHHSGGDDSLAAIYERAAGSVSFLERELFEGLSLQDGVFSASYGPSFMGFDGHFPGNPIFPGVMMIKLLQLCLSLKENKRVWLKKITRVKFGHVILPGQTFDVELNPLKEGKGKFRLVVGENICAQGVWEVWG